MCGICGVASFPDRLNPEITASVGAMTDRLRHRGPDGEGHYTDSHVALAHRRLAIIDRAGGSEPIANEDETCWVVFNGEIYNHHDLRQRLESLGHRFRTSSDTEVIVHAYEQWGRESIERLEGMFAFALYDQRRSQVLLARDRLGKKPLFYAVLDGTLHFASEIKALDRSPAWDGTVDVTTLEEYLTLGYILAPRTVYRAVKKLEPGHWLSFSARGIESGQYWDVVRFDDDERPIGQLVHELDELVRACVAERLESEVPIGVFLSGGLDSGLVVSYMAEARRDPVRTITVGFDAVDHNELDAARMTAARHHTNHHQELLSLRLEECLDTVPEGFDEPFADSSAIPMFHVSRIARREMGVALTGDGGDELFGGYDARYISHALESAFRPMFRHPFTRRIAQWGSDHWPASPRLPRVLRAGPLLDNVTSEPATAYYRGLCFLKPELARLLLGLSPLGEETYASTVVTDAYRRCPSPYDLQRAQYADLKIYLANDVLTKVDRMSMAHGMELRAPLLDRRIVEFAFAVPPVQKMRRLKPKYLLRAVASGRLPPAILDLPKRGFTAPVGQWIAGAGRERFRDEVLGAHAQSRAWLDTDLVESHLKEHVEGRTERSFELWAIWMLERWARIRGSTNAHVGEMAASSGSLDRRSATSFS